MSLFVPREVLDEIVARVDLVGLVSEQVPLKKSGKDFKGLCPFHQEKTPSFMVSPEKQIFYCFGCGQGGNAYSFLMKMENLPFPDVLKKLAGRAGVDLAPYEKGGSREKEKGANKEVLYKINRYAAWFFSHSLGLSQGETARRYLNKRGITKNLWKEFSLGYAPAGWEGLFRFLSEKKVPMEGAELLGLVRKGKEGGFYDFFRDRLIFPIMDHEGRIVGFSGRRLNDQKKETDPKYVNSPESPIYQKSQSIYGLAQAKKAIRESGEAILVEGNIDVIRLHQEGLNNAVAPLGTALTQLQISVLGRFAKNFVLMFDGDDAGQNALMRTLHLFLALGHHPRVISLPRGDDPDTYAKRKGGEALRQEIGRSLPAIEWMMLTFLPGTGGQTSKRLEAAKKVLPYIQEFSSKLDRETYLNRLAQFLGVGDEALRDLVKTGPLVAAGKTGAREDSKNSLERILLELYVRYPQLVGGVVGEEVFSQFEDDQLKELALTLWQQHQKTGTFSLGQLLGPDNRYDENLVSELAFGKGEDYSGGEPRQVAEDCLRQLKRGRLKRELKGLTGEIGLAEIKDDAALLKELLGRKNRVLQELKQLGNL